MTKLKLLTASVPSGNRFDTALNSIIYAVPPSDFSQHDPVEQP